MQLFDKRQSAWYKAACICDALAVPGIFLLWYRLSHTVASGAIPTGPHHYPGLFASSVMMILAARALVKIEQAVRMPEFYRWDLERALRWFAVLAVMALAVWVLE